MINSETWVVNFPLSVNFSLNTKLTVTLLYLYLKIFIGLLVGHVKLPCLKKSHLLNRISVLNELKSAAENLVSSCYNEPKPNI